MALSVRPAAVAGSFYPADAQALARAVASHLGLADAPAAAAPCPKLLVVPHAGYVYSGDVAAQAYARLAPHRATIRRVVLLGPVHRVPVRGLGASEVATFATPLGRVPLDRAALASLADLPQVVASDRAHALEHSLEVQLPFLQAVLGDGFTLVPLAVGDATLGQVAAVLQRLWGGPETLIVISSDLSHYLPYASAQARDAATVQRILQMATDLQGDEACGAQALNGALRCARQHGLVPRLLDLRNSADTAGRGHDRVVGYGAMAFYPAGPDGDAAATEPADSTLGQALLAAARAAIAGMLGLPVPPVPAHPALARPGATFVTLHDGRGQLRGCIGQLEAFRPLGDDVRENARAAAFADRRFAPLHADEWPTLQLEVSLLSPLQPLPAAASQAEAAALLRPGVDGVVLQWRTHRSTFLPQVWSQLPQPRPFLQHLLVKAGLPLDFWANDVQLSRYSVTAFEEPRHERPH
jgi:MEMO1 family protein